MSEFTDDKYIEIHPAKNAADKITAILSAVQAKKPGMYSKTKLIYRDLAQQLLECVDMISNILEEEMLVPDESPTDEFDELSYQVEEYPHEISERTYKFRHINDFSGNAVPTQVKPSSTNPKKPTPNQKRDTMRHYHEIITKSADVPFGYAEIDECMSYIRRWFSARFANNSDFKYSIDQIPRWISGICLWYGNSMHNGTLSKFRYGFNQWINQVTNDPNSLPWAVPSQVNNIMKSVNVNDFTIESVLIYDVLLEQHLHYLMADEYKDGVIHLDPYELSKIVKERNEELTEIINTRYSKMSDYLKEYNFTQKEDGESNVANL